MAQDKVFYGTECKYLLEITADGFDMHRDDFTVDLKRGQKTKHYDKEDLVVETYTDIVDNISTDKYRYYVCFDTKEFGTGVITAIVTAKVPDADFEDGIRDIVWKFELTAVVSV